MSTPDVPRIFATLNDHGVAYVVIGGIAAVYRKAGIMTEDTDITPARNEDNLRRLAEALRALDAQFLDPTGRVMDDVEIPWDAQLLERMGSVRTVTRYGVLDLVFRPDGTGGYDDLVRRATFVVVDSVAAPVADLRDVIRSKEAAGRAKDMAVLPRLHQRAEEIRRLRPEGRGLPVDPERYEEAAE